MGGGGVMSAVAKFAATGIRGIVPPVHSPFQNASKVSPTDGGEDSLAREVLGGFEEAKEATTELKHALHKIYLSSNCTEYQGCALANRISVLSPSESDLENKYSVTETISTPSPNRVFQTFQLLGDSSEAQSVVASIACDPKIWNAVVQNPKLQDFFHSQQRAGFAEEGTLDQKVEHLHYSDSVNFLWLLTESKCKSKLGGSITMGGTFVGLEV